MIIMSDKEKLEEIFCSLFQIEKKELSDELNPGKVEMWDSISHMALVSKLEEEFNINFTVGEINSMDSFGEIRKILKHRGFNI